VNISYAQVSAPFRRENALFAPCIKAAMQQLAVSVVSGAETGVLAQRLAEPSWRAENRIDAPRRLPDPVEGNALSVVERCK
jgi:hypothetical protein